MTTTPTEFFADQSIQSLTKARIVSKYFVAWAKILGNLANDFDFDQKPRRPLILSLRPLS